jgi:predicted MFS family arabinose efflux permease
VVTFGSTIWPAVFAPLLTFLIVMVGWRAAFVFLGIIGALWVVNWLLVARECPADESTPVHETLLAALLLLVCGVLFTTVMSRRGHPFLEEYSFHLRKSLDASCIHLTALDPTGDAYWATLLLILISRLF